MIASVFKCMAFARLYFDPVGRIAVIAAEQVDLIGKKNINNILIEFSLASF